MVTLRQWLDDFAGHYGEVIAIRIGQPDYGAESFPKSPEHFVRITDVSIQRSLDHEFDCGYGSPGCPAVYAWSESHIFGIRQYDGSTWWFAIPRNPSDDMPSMPGGG